MWGNILLTRKPWYIMLFLLCKQKKSSMCDESLWSPHDLTSSLCCSRWKAGGWFTRHHCLDWGCNSVSGRWVWQQVCVAFVLRLSPPWRYSSVEETRKGLILFLTDVVPNSRSPLPGCRGRSASSSGSADMIERSITLGYHHFQCRSSASREQRWARNQLEGVGGPAGQQVAGEARVPAPPPLGKQPYSYYRQVILG